MDFRTTNGVKFVLFFSPIQEWLTLAQFLSVSNRNAAPPQTTNIYSNDYIFRV